jgi:hypothetical protein
MAALTPAWLPELEPLESARWPIRCGHMFSATEVERLREGVWPREAEDRWALWVDGETLRCWRAGTAPCIYESRLTVAEDGSAVASVVEVLDEEPLYQRAVTDEGELERFEGVLSHLRRREYELTAEPTAPEHHGV